VITTLVMMRFVAVNIMKLVYIVLLSILVSSCISDTSSHAAGYGHDGQSSYQKRRTFFKALGNLNRHRDCTNSCCD